MRRFKWTLSLGLVVVAMALFFTLRTPGHLYAMSGTFTDCPARASCVSSVATDNVHSIAPLRVRGDMTRTMSELARHVSSLPNANIEHISPGYLHAVFITSKMRFRDDLELLVGDGQLIQVRSISRFAFRDHDRNRERVEAIRSWLDTEQNRSDW